MTLAILLKAIILLEYTVVTHTSLIELKGHQHMPKRVTGNLIVNVFWTFYSNQTLFLSLITVSCLLSRAELLLLLVHHDFATSSFTFTHPLWPLPDSEISNTFFFFSFFPDPILYVNIFLVKTIWCFCFFFLSSNINKQRFRNQSDSHQIQKREKQPLASLFKK